MKAITVFTPSYNRSYTLPKLYESLLRQTSQDFEWLIVDDGSTDNTEELVRKWTQESPFKISYFKQKNKGMLGAHNTAYDNIRTELNVCIDSDDYMPDNAIEIILTYWTKYSQPHIAGILGLDSDVRGEIMGIQFDTSPSEVKFTDLKNKYGDIGDKKFVYRTEIINQYPRFPEYETEKFPAAGLLYRKIDKAYSLLGINEVLCIVEYMEDGNSKNKIKQYIKNPNAFADYRIERMRIAETSIDRFKNAVHYVSSKLIAKKSVIDKKTPYKLLVFLAIPFGWILKKYITNTKKKGFI